MNEQRHWFALGVGVAVIGFVLVLRVRHRLPWSRALPAAFLPAGGALLAGHLLASLFQSDSLAAAPERFLGWHGLSAPGLILGLLGGGYVGGTLLGLTLAELGDDMAAGVGFGYAVARHGCVVAGCCYPLQHWYIALGVVMGVTALAWLALRPPRGEALLAMFATYGLVASLLEWFRLEIEYWGPAPTMVWTNGAIALVACSLLVWSRLKLSEDERLARRAVWASRWMTRQKTP